MDNKRIHKINLKPILVTILKLVVSKYRKRSFVLHRDYIMCTLKNYPEHMSYVGNYLFTLILSLHFLKQLRDSSTIIYKKALINSL